MVNVKDASPSSPRPPEEPAFAAATTAHSLARECETSTSPSHTSRRCASRSGPGSCRGGRGGGASAVDHPFQSHTNARCTRSMRSASPASLSLSLTAVTAAVTAARADAATWRGDAVGGSGGRADDESSSARISLADIVEAIVGTIANAIPFADSSSPEDGGSEARISLNSSGYLHTRWTGLIRAEVSASSDSCSCCCPLAPRDG